MQTTQHKHCYHTCYHAKQNHIVTVSYNSIGTAFHSLDFTRIIMVNLAIVATCNLDQWAMDFDLNLKNIISSIQQAKASGARFRTGPELEICGYGCEDHFYELDTLLHCWESVSIILNSDITDDILCDIGMPVEHRNVRYNARVFILNRKIITIRPKLYLADDGNYRESRWFAAYKQQLGGSSPLDEFILPPSIQQITGQSSVPFGVSIIQCNDCSVSSETCEELFTPDSPGAHLGLCGAEIIANGSGSHFTSRKLQQRINLIQNTTSKNGGCYLYANQQGCDGGRLYYDGCSSVYLNGSMIAQGKQFSVSDVETITACIDIDDIRSYRAAVMSRSNQATDSLRHSYPTIRLDYSMTVNRFGPDGLVCATDPIQPHFHSPAEEIAFGPACWCWDYLRRSGSSGFLLPLSGGADSSATLSIVGSMCKLVVEACQNKDQQVIDDVRRIVAKQHNPDAKDYIPVDAIELCNRIMYTVYMGTEHSSKQTRQRAKDLSKQVGSYHHDFDIDTAVLAVQTIFTRFTNFTPRFKVHGGSVTENLALQNIQARLRMVMAYMCAQLFPYIRNGSGWLLVLGSANVDESLRGYMTKYDCSSADINPIGGIAKGDLRVFLRYAADELGYSVLYDVLEAHPTAELEPTTNDYIQTDEADMGMSYEELGIFGKLRKVYRCGPVSMYNKLLHVWMSKRQLTATEIASKVKKFFYYYSVNRHKMTTLTPSYHAEHYSPDDNRYDLRQFLYNTKWTRQFQTIDKLAKQDEKIDAKQIHKYKEQSHAS